MTIKVLQHRETLPLINSGKHEIRLLTIQPGSWASSIHCNFTTSSLKSLGLPYQALSYAWGNTTLSTHQTIKIGDRDVRVTETIASALQRLRQPDEPTSLWIDALCINQDDDQEKSNQVSMMYRIYTQCDQCAIWLGPLGGIDPRDAEACFEVLSWIAGYTQLPSWLHDQQRRESAAAALNSMITLPWWSRIWTVQEAILPKQATGYWGPSELNWAVFYKAADAFFDGSAPVVPDEFWDNGGLVNLQSSMRGLSFSQGEGMFEVLWRWRCRQATDPRDKVFGLLGFRKHTTLPNLQACDYSTDTRTLYHEVTADIIRQSGDLLPLIGRGGEQSDIEGLASWAVDWNGVRDQGKCSISDFWDHLRQWHDIGYTADCGLRGLGDGLKMFDSSTLYLAGLQVDQIAVVQREFEIDNSPQSSSASSIFSAHARAWGAMITEFQNDFPSSLDGDWMKAFLGVITGKLNPEDPADGDNLDSWTQQIINPQALFVTSAGKFGVGPRGVQAGQEVWVVGGSRIPLIFKSKTDGTLESNARCRDFTFLGECFVYGIMKGEAVVGREQQILDIRLH
jgi:hypothetical protein